MNAHRAKGMEEKTEVSGLSTGKFGGGKIFHRKQAM